MKTNKDNVRANEAFTLYLESLKELLKNDRSKPRDFSETDLIWLYD